MIPEHKIQEVLERVDLVALISRHVELKKSGREWKGLCPFHQEKTPSFYVVPEKRFFFCHGCRASGDAVAFLQRYLGKAFLEAVQDLAREVGIDLEAAVDPAARERQQLKEVTDLTAEHYRSLLWADEGRRARAYLASRNVSEDTARGFGLGWAPATWSSLADRLARAGMLEWALKAGLIQARQKGEGYYDFFRSRVMIPIRAPEGRAIAFGGRLLDSEEGPKYLNSRESRLYNKSETLFGLDQARDEVRRRKSAVLVEGYFDCIALHQEGVRHAVALCSTNLTPGHLKLLGRAEARELFLLLDGDKAGLAAVERLAGPLLSAGATARVALLPQGEDPDTFARRERGEGVERLLAEARPLTTYLFATVLPEGSRATFEEKMAALERLRPVCAQLPPGLVRKAFFSALGDYCGLPPSDLETALPSKAPPPPRPAQPAPSRPAQAPARPTPSRSVAPMRLEPLEVAYVAAVLREQRLYARDLDRVGDMISHPGLRVALAHALSGHSLEEALDEADESVRRAIKDRWRLLPEGSSALEHHFRLDVCCKLLLRRIKAQIDGIDSQIEQASRSSDQTAEIARLAEQRKQLRAHQLRLEAELRPPSMGTKAPMQPV